MSECAQINRILNTPRVLNMPKFWMWHDSQYASVTQPWALNIPEHTVSVSCSSSLYLVLNTSWVLNMPGLSIRQSSEYVGVTHGSKYATVWLKMSEQNVNMPEYAWIFDSRQGSEYVYTINSARSLHTLMSIYWEILNQVRDLRWSAFEK